MLFADRTDAGRRLAEEVAALRPTAPLVLALPRGGVPVGFAVAQRLDAPLDVFVARKIGAPGRPELAVGAIAEGGEPIFDPRTLRLLGLSPDALGETVAAERVELERRVRQYRAGRQLPDLGAHDVVLVDDGLATGSTARASLRALRAKGARRLLLAVPVCPADAPRRLGDDADEVVVVEAPRRFGSVGQWYADFAQTSDDEVRTLLDRARTPAEF